MDGVVIAPGMDEAPIQALRKLAFHPQDSESSIDVHDSPQEIQDSSDIVRPSPPRTLKERPITPRSTTEPLPTTLPYASFSNPRPSTSSSSSSSSHRNRSPYSRSHLRSRSSGGTLSAPLITRSHSWAGQSASRAIDSAGATSSGSLSPASPLRSPPRTRSPFKPSEDNFNNHVYHPSPRSPSWHEPHSAGGTIESIQEDSELDLTPRASSLLHPPLLGNPFARASSLRRRPASPLHSVTNAPGPTSFPANVIDQNAPLSMSVASSRSNSPALGPQRYNEAYPALHHYASTSSFSSMSSTPTSQRSRSPSISSLETIEDVPDLESQAVEADRLERLDEGPENGEDSDDNPRRRGSLDAPRGFGFGRPGSRERKRWSVCGGERRADLDLETIWED